MGVFLDSLLKLTYLLFQIQSENIFYTYVNFNKFAKYLYFHNLIDGDWCKSTAVRVKGTNYAYTSIAPYPLGDKTR